MDIATREAQDIEDSDKSPMSALGRAGGILGGRARAEKLEKRAEIAKQPPPHGGASMTAEIAILNRQCIALAADSAVTIGRNEFGKQLISFFL